MNPPTSTLPPETGPHSAGSGCGHRVEFYATDAILVDAIADFIGPALREGDAAIIVATPEHRERLAGAIRAEGIDLEGAVEGGRYVALDAAELLSAFMVGGSPDPVRFRAAINPLMERAGAHGREVRVFGEMVALLWSDGDVSSTIELEDLWNDLATEREFTLLCAYPTHAFDDETATAFRKICSQHSAVGTSREPSAAGGRDEQTRIVGDLRKETSALRGELTQLRQEQENLFEMAYTDSLTELSNRRAFDLHLHREWELALRDGVDSFVVLADLDGFKELNDTLGHAAGDQALCQFAGCLRVAARRTDIQARVGGDEFGVLLIRCDERAAHAFEARLRDAMTSEGGGLSVSLGHASLLQSSSPEKALERADLAMLAGKRSARRGPGIVARRD